MLPKIKWRLRNVGEAESRTVMENLPTCANCHSIAHDGKTLGIDVDGPQNDKALYALIPIKKVSSIGNDYVIRWSAYTETGSPKRFGFMSQVSPDGQYVVTSIEVPGTKGQRVTDRIYQGLYDFWGYGQVFYPTRGVLAWYSKATQKLAPLPGADDPEYVQTLRLLEPGPELHSIRQGESARPVSGRRARLAICQRPERTPDSVRPVSHPFNGGKGGKAEKIVGASENGMSNNSRKSHRRQVGGLRAKQEWPADAAG
ncbi:MAG: hypothetical protein WDO73_27325 [Ignavibacteriota bacterium]